MTSVLLPLAEGFEELEAVTIIDLLRRAEIQVLSASLTEQQQVTGSRGVTLIADATLSNVLNDDFDMLVLPGGQPGTTHLNNDARIHQLLKLFHQQNKWLAAICAAPMVLAQAGLLNGTRISCYPGTLEPVRWPEINFRHEAVVCDNKIITSRGPGTAIPFTLTLIEQLKNKALSQQIESSLVIS